MRPIMEAPLGGGRVCKGGCSPDPQPLENFYVMRGASLRGFDTYKSECKACTKERNRVRYAALPPSKRGRKRDTGGETKPLATVDLVPCDDCGLRGHAAGDPDGRCLRGGIRSLGLGQRGVEWSL